MGAITDLWKSERGLMGLALIVCITVLAAIGNVTYADWQQYTMWIFGFYAGAKTLTSVAAIIKTGTDPAPLPAKTEAEVIADLQKQLADMHAKLAAQGKT